MQIIMIIIIIIISKAFEDLSLKMKEITTTITPGFKNTRITLLLKKMFFNGSLSKK